MYYSEGQLGRVFVLRIDDGEDFLAVTKDFIRNKSVKTGTILFLGALLKGRMVTGPEEPVIPPEPHYIMFEGGWEMVGMGTICEGDDGPAVHYHASVGRAGHALTGCLRDTATVYLVTEVVIFEFTGFEIHRKKDEKTGVFLPVHSKNEPRAPSEHEGSQDGQRGSAPEPEEKRKDEELPGGLAEIIRDLTRRPPGKG